MKVQRVVTENFISIYLFIYADIFDIDSGFRLLLFVNLSAVLVQRKKAVLYSIVNIINTTL